MAVEKLTSELIRSARKAPPQAERDIRDSKTPGLVLRLRPSGVHTFRVSLGRARWHTLGSADDLTIEQARALAVAARGDVAKARSLGQEDPIASRARTAKAPTLADFIDKHYEPWAVTHRRTGTEQAKRLRAIFGPDFGSRALDKIDAFTVERWRSARLKGGTSVATCNRDLNCLRAALRLAVRWELLRAFPLSDVRPGRIDASPRVRYLSNAEEERLRAVLASRDDARRAERQRSNAWRRERGYPEWPALERFTDHVTPIVLTALGTGMRRGEIFGLRWRDVDFGGAVLTVDGGGAKSGQTRHVPLNSDVLETLGAWRGASTPRPEDYVFPSADGGRLEDVKKAWASVAESAQLHGFRFHDLRHAFASKLVMRGADLAVVRELLGHADLKMTLRYAHLAPERKASAVALLVNG